MDEDELPPLQGHDPPLRRVSSAGEPEAAPWSIKDTMTSSFEQQQPKPRRGRPKNTSMQYPVFMQEESTSSSFTFLTPTTWNVPATFSQKTSSSSSSGKRNQNQIQAPRKKRGRKPKTVLEGHSCFVLPSHLQKKLQKP